MEGPGPDRGTSKAKLLANKWATEEELEALDVVTKKKKWKRR